MLTHTFSRFFALVTAGALILTCLQPQTAYACSCIWDPDLTDEQRMEQNLGYSDMAFIGRAETVTRLGDPDVNFGYYHITLSIDEVYKGDVPQQLTVGTSAAGSLCGYNFQEDMTYLVFAGYDEDGYDYYGGIQQATGLCRGNEREPTADLISMMGNVSAQVNVPTAVTAQESEAESGSANWLLAIPIVLGVTVAIFSGRKKLD